MSLSDGAYGCDKENVQPSTGMIFNELFSIYLPFNSFVDVFDVDEGCDVSDVDEGCIVSLGMPFFQLFITNF